MVVLMNTRKLTRENLGVAGKEFKRADLVCSICCFACAGAQLNRINKGADTIMISKRSWQPRPRTARAGRTLGTLLLNPPRLDLNPSTITKQLIKNRLGVLSRQRYDGIRCISASAGDSRPDRPVRRLTVCTVL